MHRGEELAIKKQAGSQRLERILQFHDHSCSPGLIRVKFIYSASRSLYGLLKDQLNGSDASVLWCPVHIGLVIFDGRWGFEHPAEPAHDSGRFFDSDHRNYPGMLFFRIGGWILFMPPA